MINLIKRNKIIYVVGKKGSGKSYLVKNRLIPLFRNIFVCDPRFEYNLHQAAIFDNFDDLIDWLSSIPENFKVICRFDNEEYWRGLFKLVYEWSNCTIVIEELNEYVELFLKTEDEYFKRLTRYSRHKCVNVIGINQRAADTPRLFTSQADTFISFRQDEPRDLAYIAERFGEEAARQVAALGQWEFAQFGEYILNQEV